MTPKGQSYWLKQLKYEDTAMVDNSSERLWMSMGWSFLPKYFKLKYIEIYINTMVLVLI
jgi:hypothetical protein